MTLDPKDAEFWRLLREEYMEGKEATTEEVERLQEVIDFIREMDDKKAPPLLRSLVRNCIAYYEAIIRHAQMGERNKGQVDAGAYRADLENADRYRKIKHNGVINDLKIFNRYMHANYGPDGKIDPHEEDELPRIFTGTSTERRGIAFWALRLADGLRTLRGKFGEEIDAFVNENEAMKKAS